MCKPGQVKLARMRAFGREGVLRALRIRTLISGQREFLLRAMDLSRQIVKEPCMSERNGSANAALWAFLHGFLNGE